MVPPVETEGSATFIAVLVGNQLVVTGTHQNLEIFRFGAAIHRAPPGEEGPPVQLDAVPGSFMNGSYMFPDNAGAEGKFSATFDLTDNQVQDLKAGLWYVQLNLWSENFGEIRGQLTSQIDFTQVEFDPTAQDVTAEDMVGIWQAEGKEDAEQYYPDGHWTALDTLAEAGEDPSPDRTWSIKDNILTLNNGMIGSRPCGGHYLDYLEKQEDGSLRMLSLHAQEDCGGGVGSWRRWVQVEP